MYYSVFDHGCKKHDGSPPLVGVNNFLSASTIGNYGEIELIRSTEEEKSQQTANVKRYGRGAQCAGLLPECEIRRRCPRIPSGSNATV